MLAGPFPASLVIARLQTLSELRTVGGAAALATATETPPQASPAAYVQCEETGRAGDYGGKLAQPISAFIQIVLCVRNAGSVATGAKAAEAMEGIERAVRSSLRTWGPPAPFGAPHFVGSGGDTYQAGLAIRQLIFQSEYRDQEQVP